MFPKSVDTPRGRHLQAILQSADKNTLSEWLMPTKDDFVLVGAFVVLYSYIDFDLKRILEGAELAGMLERKAKARRTNEIAQAIQGLGWPSENQLALSRIEEFRSTRNLLAHCVIRRFPNEDAFAFLFKSARDYRDHFGGDPPPGISMTAVADREQLVEILQEVEHLHLWLAKATVEFEEKLEASGYFNNAQ